MRGQAPGGLLKDQVKPVNKLIRKPPLMLNAFRKDKGAKHPSSLKIFLLEMLPVAIF